MKTPTQTPVIEKPLRRTNPTRLVHGDVRVTFTDTGSIRIVARDAS
jgi:hypothetical protein